MNSKTKAYTLSFLLNLVLVGVAVALTYYITPRTYESFFCEYIASCGGLFDLSMILWMVGLYNLLITFLLVAFGGKYRYWWVGIFHVPVFLLILVITIPSAIRSIGVRDMIMPLVFLFYWALYIFFGFVPAIFLRKVVEKLVKVSNNDALKELL